MCRDIRVDLKLTAFAPFIPATRQKKLRDTEREHTSKLINSDTNHYYNSLPLPLFLDPEGAAFEARVNSRKKEEAKKR
jgi:hypothetical protein